MTTPIIQQGSSQLGDLSQLLKVISPEFGSGKTTESQQSSTNTGDADELLKQIYASANPQDIDNMVENILNRAKQAFGPAAIGANAAGVRAYSDTTETQLRNEAMARATGEAAQAKLAAVNNAHKTAASVVDAKMQNTRQVTSQKKTGMSPTGMGLLVGLGASAIKNKVKKGMGGADQAAGTSTGIDNSSYSRDEYGPENVAQAEDDVAVSQTPIVNSVDVMNSSDGVDAAISAAVDSSDIGDFIPATSEDFATDLGSEAGGDEVGAAIDEVAGEDLATEEGSSVLEDIFGGFFADGGVVPGTRAAPGAYEPGVLDAAKNTKANSKATLAQPEQTLSEPNILAVIKAPTAPVKKTTTSVEGAAGEGGTTGASMSATDASSGNFGSFSPSASAVAMAAMNALAGNVPGAMMSLTASALSNAIATSTTNPDAATADDASLGASMTAESNAAAADFASAMASDSDQGLAGFMGGNMGFSDSNDGSFGSPDAGGDASFAGGASDAGGAADGGGSDGGGDGGGGDGGGEADGGVIYGKTAADSEGIDRVVIHVTPGEAVLPVDTVEALGGEDAIDELIRQTHGARKVNKDKVKNSRPALIYRNSSGVRG